MMSHRGLNWLQKAIKPCELSMKQRNSKKKWISITCQDDFSKHSKPNFRFFLISTLLNFINPDLQKQFCFSLNIFCCIEGYYWEFSKTFSFYQELWNSVIEKHMGNVVGMCLSLSANPCSAADMIWRSPLKAYLGEDKAAFTLASSQIRYGWQQSMLAHDWQRNIPFPAF